MNANSVYFYLSPNSRDKSGMPQKRYPPQYTFKHFCQIPDPRAGNEGALTYIRYKAGENTIFVDQQRANFDPIESATHRTAEKIRFMNGKLVVPLSNKLLLEYLRNCVYHKPVAEKAGYTAGKTFFEYKPKEIEREQALTFSEDNKLRVGIARMPRRDKNAVYRALSNRSTIYIEQEMNDEELDYSLYMIAQANVENFKEVKRFKYLDVKYDIYVGLDRGILKQGAGVLKNELYWSAGNVHIVKAPLAGDPIDHFAEYLAEQASDMLKLLRKQLGVEGADDVKDVKDINLDEKIDIDEKDAEEIVKFVKENKKASRNLFTPGEKMPAHKFFLREGHTEPTFIGTRHDEMVKNLLADKGLLNEVRERYKELLLEFISNDAS